jgi:serine/threonine-protein kinase ULK/ATG1
MNVCELDREYYYINDPIGYGSFSVIFKGYRYSDRMPIAVKLITKIIDQKYFENEVQIMKNIEHPNILKLYKVIKKDGKIYLILEYCNGGDLSNYIQKKCITFDNRYFFQILDGLEYLYNNQVLHRDIKPQNILIHNDSIKISDFGFAKSFEKSELITTFCGSPLYMAPEILKDRKYSEKSDIWSLGVLLYELLTKEHPYYCSSKVQLWDMAKKNKFIIDFGKIDNLSKRNLVKNLLKYNFNERINWHSIFQEKIQHRERLFSGEDFSDVVVNDQTTQSVLIPSRPINIDNKFYSVMEKKDESYIQDYDDCTVYSRSAPNSLGLSYLENYINETNQKNDTKFLPIIGTSPNLKPKSFSDYLGSSLSSLKNFLI